VLRAIITPAPPPPHAKPTCTAPYPSLAPCPGTSNPIPLALLSVRYEAANGGANFFLLHGGSSLRLTALMVLCGHAIWCCFYPLYHRLPHKWTRALLPAVAALPVCGHC